MVLVNQDVLIFLSSNLDWGCGWGIKFLLELQVIMFKYWIIVTTETDQDIPVFKVIDVSILETMAYQQTSKDRENCLFRLWQTVF